ncbi:TATA box-binding protein-associated factor RNA polymerase I subunit D [Nannospalax galili]|uniref:TATA box-binding protein-associated factor RNA polymerase I subunit D n=1 Tax=Nannospalax galili TaxID=1026970 RepID=UPI0004ED0FC3|nr:TATA box-binding protein-associated factor RNA polymerase I subunit D [Nannospalax galili]
MDRSQLDAPGCPAPDGAGESGSQSDDTSGSSLFKTQCAPSPKQRPRAITAELNSPASPETDSSSDSSLEPRALTLKAIFERFKKKKRKKGKKRKYKPKLRPRGRPEGRKNSRRSQIDKKQIKEKGPVFPFSQSENGGEPLPWRKILTYEQAVARGFFNHIEKLKYEHHLKESLKQMDAGEDLEKEDLDSRRYKYLDDDGSISPIEDPLTEDEVTHPEPDGCDITLVDDSCFIISSEFPKKAKNTKVTLSKERTSKAENTRQTVRNA